MSSNLVIVESPAKAKTIKKYLGKDFEVLASYGHVRDLVAKEGAVDVNRDGWNIVKREFKAGRSINITGASGALQYDPETEETTAPIVYWKINDAGTDFENVP
mgnify:CR=1 FL=1